MTCLHIGCMCITICVAEIMHRWCQYACRMYLCVWGGLLSLHLYFSDSTCICIFFFPSPLSGTLCVGGGALITTTVLLWLYMSIYIFSSFLPCPLRYPHTSSSVSGGEGGLVASSGSSAEGGESKSPQRQASLEQRLSEIIP